MKRPWILGSMLLLAPGHIFAEFGVNVLIGSNYKADFGMKSGIYSASNPGAETGIADRTYDDGYNLIDSSDNAGDLTTYWGYSDSSQYDSSAATITMNSQRLNLAGDAQVHADENHGQPGLEFWWQGTLLSGMRNEPYQPKRERDQRWRWYLDWRAALRWQHVELAEKGYVSGSVDNVADVYSTGGATPPSAPFNGTFMGPNMALDAIPLSRNISPVGGAAGISDFDLETDVLALDIGPTLIFDLDFGARFSMSAGASLAFAHSELDYRYGEFYSGKDTVDEALLGWYASIDFLFAEGAVLGFSTYQLQELEHNDGAGYASLDFSDSYTFRFGIAF